MTTKYHYAYHYLGSKSEPTFMVEPEQWVDRILPNTECDLYLSSPLSPDHDNNFKFVGLFKGEPTQLIINQPDIYKVKYDSKIYDEKIINQYYNENKHLNPYCHDLNCTCKLCGVVLQ